MNRPMPEMKMPVVARTVASVFGFAFFGIGVTVLVFLWTARGFGAPPLFVRMFGSFIALAFVVFGGVMCVSALLGGKGMGVALGGKVGEAHQTRLANGPAMVGRYACTHCGAPLGEKAAVSPLGDAKCAFCGAWFNIHGKKA